MLIHELKLINFRQFKGEQTLRFSTDPERNVTVLLGDNTFGKTTILQAFNWCLYGKVDFPDDNSEKLLLNLELADEYSRAKQASAEVQVEMLLEHGGVNYKINRRQIFHNGGNNKWFGEEPALSISYKTESGFDKQIKEGEQKRIINEILPESLSEYFFFDTEHVSNISNKKDLSNAVNGLMGLEPVKNARKHLGDKTKKLSAIGQWYNGLNENADKDVQEAFETIYKANSEIEAINYWLNQSEEQLKKLNAQKDAIHNKLLANKETEELQRQSQRLEDEIENETAKKGKKQQALITAFNTNVVKYYMYPLILKAESKLHSAGLDEHSISDVTENTIKDLIKRGYCICGNKIEKPENGSKGKDAYQHLMKELDFVPPKSVGNEISNTISLFDKDVDASKNFFDTIKNYYSDIRESRQNISNMMQEKENIDEEISGTEDMSEYVEKEHRINAEIKDLQNRINEKNQKIGKLQADQEHAQKIINNNTVISENKKRLVQYIAYAEKIVDWIDENYDTKEAELRKELENEVNNIFDQMYHGQRKVEIDDNYRIQLKTNINGYYDVDSGESEGLKCVKNFAFIAGIVSIAKKKTLLGKGEGEISWNNEAYPLVMDAPFSNADEKHIKNISKLMPSVANQIIMFVMNKDFQYAQPVIAQHIGCEYELNKLSETYSEVKLKWQGDQNV